MASEVQCKSSLGGATSPIEIHTALHSWIAAERGVDDPAALHAALWSRQIADGDPALFVRMPLAIGEGLTGLTLPFIPIAGAAHLLFLGIDLLDNVADRELDPIWASRYGTHAPDVATLAACTLITCAPPLLLSQCGIAAELRASIGHTIAENLWTSAKGQMAELGLDIKVCTGAEAEAASAAKNSGHVRVLAWLPILAAREHVDVPQAQAEALVQAAVHAAAAAQLSSDLAEIFTCDPSRDIAACRATPPLARAVGTLRDRDPVHYARLLDLLGGGVNSASGAALAEIRSLVEATGALRAGVLRVAVHVAAARRSTEEAQLRNPDKLMHMLQEMSALEGLAPS